MTTASLKPHDVVSPWLDLGRTAAEDVGSVLLKGYGLWHGFVFGVLEAPLAAAKPAAKPAPAPVVAAAPVVVEASVVAAPAAVVTPPAPAKKAKAAAKPEAASPAPAAIDPAGDFDDALVTQVAPALLDAPRGVADDLKKIKGIGAKLERLLNDVGIWHYGQIASLTPGEIAWINAKIDFKGRIQRDRWVSQARDLAG